MLKFSIIAQLKYLALRYAKSTISIGAYTQEGYKNINFSIIAQM